MKLFAVAVLCFSILASPGFHVHPHWLNFSESGVIALCSNPPGKDSSEWFAVGKGNSTISFLRYGRVEWSLRVKGPVIITKNVTAFRRDFGYLCNCTVVEKRAILPNAGGTIVWANSLTHGRFTYRRAKSGEIFYRDGNVWRVRYRDWSDFSPLTLNASCEIVETPAEFNFTAGRAILVSYTYTKPVNVRNLTVYVDSHPVGGIPGRELEILPNSSYMLRSKSYGFFHYKFAVSGNLAVLTTENWKWNKRGYIVEIRDERAVNFLKNVVKHDSAYAVKFSRRISNSGSNARNANDEIWPAGNSKRIKGNFCVTIFVMPDCNPILKLIEKSRRRLYIEAPYIKPYPRLINAIKNASRRVKVLIVTRERCPCLENVRNVSVRFYPFPLHGKLIVSDGTAIITSANLDRYGFERNRELGIVFRGRASEWLAENFLRDYYNSDTYSIAPFFTALSMALLPALTVAFLRLSKKAFYPFRRS